MGEKCCLHSIQLASKIQSLQGSILTVAELLKPKKRRRRRSSRKKRSHFVPTQRKKKSFKNDRMSGYCKEDSDGEESTE